MKQATIPRTKVPIKGQEEKYYSQKARNKMPDSDFAGPHQSYPIRTQQDVYNAARLVGHAADPAAVKAAIIRIAKRKGFKLPDSWQTEEKPKEAAAPTAAFQPKSRIARIKSYFLEDDAISLNGRQYPKEAVDRLIQSAQVQLSDPNALPLTCYLSHDSADQDRTRDIAGKITYVGREGRKGYALIDIPDTAAGRDVVSLISGGYIRSQSLRASGAEMRVDSEHTFPLVGGTGLKLEGVDFTSSPGLPQVARIEDIVTESHEPQTLSEVFNAHPNSMLLEELPPMSTPIQEETIYPLTSGDSMSVTGGDPRDDYSKRTYSMPPSISDDSGASSALTDVHDRIAYVMGKGCAPDTMEAVRRFGTDIVLEREKLQEAGAKLSASTKGHLMKAHDGVAQHLGMECADSSAGNDGMQDGDDDDLSSRDKENLTRQDVEAMVREAVQAAQPKVSPPVQQKETKKTMTKEEAARLLAEAGYEIKPPKTKDELVQEQIDAKLAEQRQQMEAQQAALLAQMEKMEKMLTERMNPYAARVQRQSLVEGANAQEKPKRPYYRNGDYLKEQLRGLDRRELLDRSRPLPEGIDPERLLNELQKELLGLYDARFGLSGDGDWAELNLGVM